MASRYDLMKDSVVLGTDGTYYKDPLVFSEKDIDLDNDPVEYELTRTDIERFDLFIAKTYGGYNYYKDIVLQHNNKSYQWDYDNEDVILIPEKVDLDRFLRRNREG
jgi:hypothetical protein